MSVIVLKDFKDSTDIVTDDRQSRRKDQTGRHANQDSLAQDELVVFSAQTCEHHGYD